VLGGGCEGQSTRPRSGGVLLGDIARAHGAALRQRYALTPEQHAVLRAVERCRTAALGGHQHVCDRCGHTVPMYNSCRNRHCPTCQSLAQHQWIERRRETILPVPYFHLVFTLPSELRPVVAMNRERLFAQVMARLFRRLFRAALLKAVEAEQVRVRPDHVAPMRKALFETKWIAYAKAPFGGAEQVYGYLGRYTHRVGNSNARILRRRSARRLRHQERTHVLPPSRRVPAAFSPARVAQRLSQAQALQPVLHASRRRRHPREAARHPPAAPCRARRTAAERAYR